jgi:uncharacterized protein
MDIVYYHAPCQDGWVAAFVAKLRYPEAKLVPLSYGGFELDDLFEEAKGKDILMVDFSLKSRIANDTLNRVAKSLLILDHHKTAQEIIGDAPYARFDMNRSGAGLAWDYLFGVDSPQAGTLNVVDPFKLHRPWYVNYAEDQDLWRWKLPNSRDINAYLNVQTRTFSEWKAMIEFLAIGEGNSLEQIARLGGAINQYVNYAVAAAMKDLNVGFWQILGKTFSVGVVNTGSVASSQIGEEIYNSEIDIALMWHENNAGQILFSLRSKVADVGAIAKCFPGGGGHKVAGGFELSVVEGRNLIDFILGRNRGTTIGSC